MLDLNLSESINNRVVNHRNVFYNIIVNRYFNILPTLVKYKCGDVNVNIDFYTLEYILRYYGNAIVGLDDNKKISLIGYATNAINDTLFFNEKNVNVKKLNNTNFNQKIKIISNIDEYKTGNCVIIFNKLNRNSSDFPIVDYYAQELCEINLSRFSLILQSKINTIFKSDVGDETITQIVQNLYNGAPFIKTNKYFDVEDQIITLDKDVSNMLNTLKNEYNNKLSELNNMLGVNTSFKEKESGVSNLELNGNVNYINSNAQIYLNARKQAFFKLNKRFNVKIECEFRELKNEVNG